MSAERSVRAPRLELTENRALPSHLPVRLDGHRVQATLLRSAPGSHHTDARLPEILPCEIFPVNTTYSHWRQF